MNHEYPVEDFTGYDCTGLMIRLKIRLMKVGTGDTLVITISPDQLRTVADLLPDDQYRTEYEETGDGTICLTITKPD